MKGTDCLPCLPGDSILLSLTSPPPFLPPPLATVIRSATGAVVAVLPWCLTVVHNRRGEGGGSDEHSVSQLEFANRFCT